MTERERLVDVAEVSRDIDRRIAKTRLTPNEAKLVRALDHHLLKWSRSFDGIAREQLQEMSGLRYERDFIRARNGIISKRLFWYEPGVGGSGNTQLWGYVTPEDIWCDEQLARDIAEIESMLREDPNPSEEPLGLTPRDNPSENPEDTETEYREDQRKNRWGAPVESRPNTNGTPEGSLGKTDPAHPVLQDPPVLNNSFVEWSGVFASSAEMIDSVLKKQTWYVADDDAWRHGQLKIRHADLDAAFQKALTDAHLGKVATR